ncbi:MAG: nucleotidyl transferase AbiEii/AbiGii toxin family protein [Actinomycetales bacterium]|nr:nucleotidyl transferase AbiEii/AbiGii toxin family protein [Actinomycetales bacterium]
MQESQTFVRLSVAGQDDLIVDIGLDSPPDLPPTMSILGPTYAPLELAARKLLALFDRAMPRDFVDVFRLVQRWNREELMSLARAIDPGFDTKVLATAVRQLDRYRNDDIPIGATELPELRAYFHGWAQELASEVADGRQQARTDA